jgi:two-component system sensor histidine kinase KdpD
MSGQSMPEPTLAASPLHPAVGYAAALAMAAAATLAALAVDQRVAIPNLSLVFVLPVVIAALSFGWGPSLTAAVTGVLAYDVFLIAPRQSLRVNDPANVWALSLLMVVAALVSAVAARSRRRRVEALALADQAAALQGLARALVAAPDRKAILEAAAEALQRLFSGPAVVLTEGPDGLAPATGAALEPADVEAARWALAAKRPTKAGAYPAEAATFDFWPVAGREPLIVGVALARPAGRPADPERLVEIVGAYLSTALARERPGGRAMEARVEQEGQRLKADLIAAVSHDLRTPLSTMLLTLQSLRRFGDAHDAGARAELLALAEAETARLIGMVANLLDMSRIDADALTARLAPVPMAELIEAAITQAAPGARVIETTVEPPELTAEADFALTRTALANVIQNAGKYAAAGTSIRIRAAGAEGQVLVEVADQGPGFSGPTEPLFGKFTRGVEGDGRAPGTGLGLSIARSFMDAQGGRIEAWNSFEGAVVRLWLPGTP